MRFFYITCLFFSLSIFSAKSQSDQDSSGYIFIGNYIHFGDGGGFSGMPQNSYMITEKEGSYTFVITLTDTTITPFNKEISAKDIQQLFRYIKKNNLMKVSLDEPGNVYSFITIALDNESNTLTWDPQDKKVPEHIRILYANLQKLVR